MIICLSTTEWQMLERMHRFCAKSIQKLGRRARTDICCPLLGLSSLMSHIDKIKLGFLRRLVALPSSAVSKRIFIQRYFQKLLDSAGRINITGYADDIHTILKKYDLLDDFSNLFINTGICHEKMVWKRMCASTIEDYEVRLYNQRTENDPNLVEFSKIHSDITKPNKLWELRSIHTLHLNVSK